MSEEISVRVPREANKELVDSSAYAKYFANRAGSGSAGNHLIQPAIIVLAFAEVTDALTQKTALGEIIKEDAESPLRKMVETRARRAEQHASVGP